MIAGAVAGVFVLLCLCLVIIGVLVGPDEAQPAEEPTAVDMVEEATAEPVEVEPEPTQDLFLRPTVVTILVTDTPEPTATPEPTNTPEPIVIPTLRPLGTPWPDDQLRQRIEEVLGDRLVRVSVQPELHNVLIEFAVAEALMVDTTRDEAKMDIYNSMVVVADSNHDTDVEFKGYFGGSPEDRVIWAMYGSRISRDDLEDFGVSNIYDLASFLELHQFLQE